MHRRDVLRAAGAAFAVSLAPRQAHAIWRQVASGERPTVRFGPSHRALVSALADTLIPRTDSPGASDVGVPEWIEIVVADHFTGADRRTLLEGLDAIDAPARKGGTPFARLDRARREAVVAALDRRMERVPRWFDPSPGIRRKAQGAVRRAERAFGLHADVRAYEQVKSLIVHGYFTSERVEREVLNVVVVHTGFDGSAEHVVPSRRAGS